MAEIGTNGTNRFLWVLLSSLTAIGGYACVTLISHVTRTDVHEGNEAKVNRIKTVVRAEVPPPEVNLRFEDLQRQIDELRKEVDELKR